MAQFRYLGDDERVFPESSLTVTPGELVERDTNPDPQRFEPAAKPTPVVPPKDEA